MLLRGQRFHSVRALIAFMHSTWFVREPCNSHQRAIVDAVHLINDFAECDAVQLRAHASPDLRDNMQPIIAVREMQLSCILQHSKPNMYLNLVSKFNTLVNRTLQSRNCLFQALLLVIIQLAQVVDVLSTCVCHIDWAI